MAADNFNVSNVTAFVTVAAAHFGIKSGLTDYENNTFGTLHEHRLINLYDKLILIQPLCKLIHIYLSSAQPHLKQKYDRELISWHSMSELLGNKFIVFVICTIDQITSKYELSFENYEKLLAILNNL